MTDIQKKHTPKREHPEPGQAGAITVSDLPSITTEVVPGNMQPLIYISLNGERILTLDPAIADDFGHALVNESAVVSMDAIFARYIIATGANPLQAAQGVHNFRKFREYQVQQAQLAQAMAHAAQRMQPRTGDAQPEQGEQVQDAG